MKIKEYIKKYFPFVTAFYWNICRLRFNLFGTAVNEKKWIKRDVGEIKNDFTNLNHPHRRFLIEKISNRASFHNVLEIGCGYGPNLYLLSQKFPDVNFTGIDINNISIEEGKKWLAGKGIKNIKLFFGKADDLRFPEKSFDIVFTDATLIYIGPDKIKKVFSEMKRIAKKAIIVLEHHSEKERASGLYNNGNWLRNYKNLFEFSGLKINVVKMPNNLWGGDWNKFGYLIEVLID